MLSVVSRGRCCAPKRSKEVKKKNKNRKKEKMLGVVSRRRCCAPLRSEEEVLKRPLTSTSGLLLINQREKMKIKENLTF